MEIREVNNSLNFGYSRGNNYIEDFSPRIKEHADIIDLVSHLDALNDFGKNYDYVTAFRYKDYNNVLCLPVYELKLIPVEKKDICNKRADRVPLCNSYRLRRKNKHNKLLKERERTIPNLPAEFCVWKEAHGYDAFVKNLKSVTLQELEFSLKLALKNKQQIM